MRQNFLAAIGMEREPSQRALIQRTPSGRPLSRVRNTRIRFLYLASIFPTFKFKGH